MYYYRQALLTTSPSLTTYSYSVDIFDLATVAYKNGLYMAIFSCSTYTKNLLYEQTAARALTLHLLSPLAD